MTQQTKRKNALKCVICRSEIDLSKKIYQSPETYGIVCYMCIRKFPKRDLELIIQLLLAYGGYFAQYRNFNISIIDIIKDMTKEIKISRGNIDLVNINQNLLHKALLHGYTPEEYIHKLQKFLDLSDINFYS